MTIDFENYLIPVIMIGCLCIGFVMKKWLPADDKWIPTALLILGAVSGIILFGFDYEGVVKGMLSGLASVGLHQTFHQHLKLPSTQNTFNTDSFLEMMDEDYTESEVVEDENQNGMSEE